MAEEWQVDMWVPREESCLLWGSCLSPPCWTPFLCFLMCDLLFPPSSHVPSQVTRLETSIGVPARP